MRRIQAWIAIVIIGGCAQPLVRPDALGSGDSTQAAKPTGSLACGDTKSNLSTSQDLLDGYGCLSGFSFSGSEWVSGFTVNTTGDVVVSLKDFDWYPMLVVLRDMGAGANPADCVTANWYAVRFAASAGEKFYIVVDQDGAVPTLSFDLRVDCNAAASESACGDGFDNDADYHPDCTDTDCRQDAACGNGLCAPRASVTCNDRLVAGATSAFGSTNVLDTYACWHDRVANSQEITYSFDAPSTGWVNFTVSNFGQYPMLFVLEDDGGSCNPNYCLAHNYYSVSFYATQGRRYYIVVDGWGGTPYMFDYSVICDPPAQESSCADDIDEDGDALIDCADDDCGNDPSCSPGGTCQPAEVIDCNTRLLPGDTAGAGSTNVVSGYACTPELQLGGPEVAYELAPLTQTKPVVVTLSDLTNYAVLSVLEDQGAGCDPQSCVAEQYYSARFTAQRNTRYYVVVEGDFAATASYALSVVCDPPTSETGLCSDNIDNDGDFAIDCADTDCAGACSTPGACTATGALDCASRLIAGSTAGGANAITSYGCYPPATLDGNETTYSFLAAQSGWVNFTLSDETDYAAVAVLEDTGTCDPLNCVAFQYYSALAYLEAGRAYFVVVDGMNLGSVDYAISAVCNPPAAESDCGNNVDDDGDFLIDCLDADCGC